MPKKISDYIFHPPSGSSVPGKIDANPFMNYPPDDLRGLLRTQKDETELAKIKSALKQWERQCYDTGFRPFKKLSSSLRDLAMRLRKAEVVQPAQNLPYYQDIDQPEGLDSVFEGLENYHDNYDAVRFDYKRQGERPLVDLDFLNGDFLTPKDRIFEQGVVSPRGDGSDPEGMDYPFPPTGGPIDQWPDTI
jgi:hypothetical protein